LVTPRARSVAQRTAPSASCDTHHDPANPPPPARLWPPHSRNTAPQPSSSPHRPRYRPPLPPLALRRIARAQLPRQSSPPPRGHRAHAHPITHEPRPRPPPPQARPPFYTYPHHRLCPVGSVAQPPHRSFFSHGWPLLSTRPLSPRRQPRTPPPGRTPHQPTDRCSSPSSVPALPPPPPPHPPQKERHTPHRPGVVARTLHS